MGLSSTETKRLQVIGLLHDIGKIVLPKEILIKPARLTTEEFEVIRTHPLLGSNLIQSAGYDNRIAQAVKNHHERLDGSGYPSGLRENELDLLSKIVAVADVYEAITADRPYRKALPYEAAITELHQADKFDQEVVWTLETGLIFNKAPAIFPASKLANS